MGHGHQKKKLFTTNQNNNQIFLGSGHHPGGGGRYSPTHSHCSSSSFTNSCSSISLEDHGVLERISRSRRIVYTSLFLICTAVYWNSLSGQFVFDDITAIVENRDLRPHVPLRNLWANDFWGTPMIKEQSHKSYRPLTVLSFRLNYLWSELEPLSYHLVNLVLHGSVTILYYHTCRQVISASAITSLVASLLFALHPIHTEAVTGVVGRAELLASLAYLSAILTYGKGAAHKTFPRKTRWRYLLLTIILTTIAMLCKEQGITVIAVCAVFEVCVRHKLKDFSVFKWKNISSAVQRLGVLMLCGLGLLLMRLRLMGATLPVFTRFDNPAAVSPSPAKQLTFSYLASLNAWQLLAPCDLICDWTMNTVPLVKKWLDVRNLATLAFLLVSCFLLKFILKCKSAHLTAVTSMACALTLFPFLPASNLFFPVGFVVAERVLYMPSMGFCLLVSLGWKRLYYNHKASAGLGLILLLGLFSVKTLHRNGEWSNEFLLFQSGLKVTQNNAKLINNLGHTLESRGDYRAALQYFLKAIQVQPDDMGGHINVGRIYNHLKLYPEAEEAYLKAKSLLPESRPGKSYQARVAPNHLNVFLNLATLIAQNESRLEEADQLYRQAISMRSDYTQAYINRGEILLRLNRTKEAREVYQAALGFENDNPDLLYNMGVLALSQGQHSEAMAYLNKALDQDPDHYQALLNSAILIQESGSSHLNHVAQERLLRIVNQRGGKKNANERVYFNLGMLAMDQKDLASAERWFRQAIEVKPDFRSGLFNLALLLSESDHALEAEPFLWQLLSYYPGHIKGLILLGDLYVNLRGDLKAAEKCYRRILAIDPDNVQANHNLCVVMVEAGDLINARLCLEKVAQMAPPSEGYVNKHLRIVEERLEQKFKLAKNS